MSTFLGLLIACTVSLTNDAEMATLSLPFSYVYVSYRLFIAYKVRWQTLA